MLIGKLNFLKSFSLITSQLYSTQLCNSFFYIRHHQYYILKGEFRKFELINEGLWKIWEFDNFSLIQRFSKFFSFSLICLFAIKNTNIQDANSDKTTNCPLLHKKDILTKLIIIIKKYHYLKIRLLFCDSLYIL